MKKLMLIGAASFAATCFAVPTAAQDHGNSEPQGNAYGHGCFSSPTVGDRKTPGHYFRALKNETVRFEGLNPAEIVDSGISQETIHELLEAYCDNEE